MSEMQENFEVDDELVDEIVDEILNSREQSNGMPAKKMPTGEILQRHNLGEMVKLKSRVFALENRLEKYINSFKITAVEVEREISERNKNLDEDNEQQILSLQGQLANLRTAVIRLSNDVKRLKETMGVK